MRVTDLSRHEATKSSTSPASNPPSCPFCGGHTIETRGARRCLRCHWSVCEGCECAADFPECDPAE
jgi:hypothetical protein